MPQTKKAKNAIAFGVIFGIIAIVFAVMFYLNTIGINVIKSLDLFLTATYVSYFLGLALFFNASYCKEKGFNRAKTFSMIAGMILTVVAIGLLAYGFATGKILFFGL